jgi:alpha-1,6-mannosyltransferase
VPAPIPDPRGWRSAEAALFGSLFLLLAARAASRQWLGDFWEHAAVVRELAARPMAPRHPILDLDAPHAFASPYALGVALLSRFRGLGPIAALEIAGVVNLAVLLTGLYAFTRAVSPRRAAPLLTLWFTLFLWGPEAWRYSGFYHLASIGHVMPYPSTLASGLTLLLLAAHTRSGEEAGRKGTRRSAVTALVAALVLLMHALTFLVLACGLAAFRIGRAGSLASARRLALTLAAAVLIAAPWPYFPLLKLLLGEAAVFHPGNDVLYFDPLSRTWPALLGLPVLVWRFSRDRRDPLALFFAALAGVYVLGGVAGAWSYGRVVAFAVLVLHVALADRLAAFLEEAPSAVPALPALVVALLFVGATAHPWLAPVAREAREARLVHDPWLEFLKAHVGTDEVVLTPPDYSWYVPVFSGKLVGYPHRLAFVPDQNERREAVERYFGDSVGADERRRVRARWNVAAVLLPKVWLPDWERHAAELAADGAVPVYETGEHLLLRTRRGR